MKTTKKESLFGVTSMGEKGQVVIPADIRAELNLVKGEKLIVMHKHGRITLIPASNFEAMAERLTTMSTAFMKAKTLAKKK
ncbi:MAG: AbrB/MazE/SpoVT family DNA-binding domain-containing protein [Patescibacteria group bacterium]